MLARYPGFLQRTATGKTIDFQLCSNQSFWEQKSCSLDNYRRCTGATPGQCGRTTLKEYSCKDGSSEIESAQGGDCGDDLMCRARGRIWKNLNVCIKDQSKCDQVVHCEGKEEEANCNQTAMEKCGDDCDKAYRGPNGGQCEDKNNLMCRARDGKWAGEKICLKKKFLCDNYIQCEDGKDEERCEGEYLRKRTFPRGYNFVCRILSLNSAMRRTRPASSSP